MRFWIENILSGYFQYLIPFKLKCIKSFNIKTLLNANIKNMHFYFKISCYFTGEYIWLFLFPRCYCVRCYFLFFMLHFCSETSFSRVYRWKKKDFSDCHTFASVNVKPLLMQRNYGVVPVRYNIINCSPGSKYCESVVIVLNDPLMGTISRLFSRKKI